MPPPIKPSSQDKASANYSKTLVLSSRGIISRYILFLILDTAI